MAVSKGVINPDLAKERRKAKFDVEQLTHFLYGGPEKTRRRRFLRELKYKIIYIICCYGLHFINYNNMYKTVSVS